MNVWTSSLLVTLLCTSTLSSASIDCKDGKCFAILPTPTQQEISPAPMEETTTAQNVHAIEYTIEQDFVPLELTPTTPPTEEPLMTPQMEENTILIAMNLIEEENNRQPLVEENLESSPADFDANTVEAIEEREDQLIATGEIEYVCEEEQSVVCDIETHICICA